MEVLEAFRKGDGPELSAFGSFGQPGVWVAPGRDNGSDTPVDIKMAEEIYLLLARRIISQYQHDSESQ